MYVDRVRVRRSVLRYARARMRLRVRARACASKENVHVSSCVPLGARGKEAIEGERKRDREERRVIKEGPIDGPPARGRTTVGSLRHQNGRKDSTLASASVSSLRASNRRIVVQI